MPEIMCSYTTDISLITAMGEFLAQNGVNVMNQTNQEEKKTMLYQYIQERTATGKTRADGTTSTVKLYIRKIVTDLPDDVREAYIQSAQANKVVNGILAISTGNWHYRFLEELAAKGGHFTVTVMTNKEVKMVADPIKTVKNQVNGSTFSYANADNAIYLKVHGANNQTLKELGLGVRHSRKSAKRLMEVLRLAEMSFYSDTRINTWDIKVMKFDHMDPILFDGMSYMRESMAVGLAYGIKDATRRFDLIHQIEDGKLTRCVLRSLDDRGLIKGDVIIVPDKQIDHDLVTVDDNLKDELVTWGMINSVVIWEHAPRHMAVYDQQSTINFGAAFPEINELNDISKIYTSMKYTIEMGELPKWLTMGEDAYTESGVPANRERLSDDLHKTYVRLGVAGIDVRVAQNIVFMALNGVAKRMDTEQRYSRVTNRKYRIKTWVPMSNAVLGAVVTYESLTMLGGFSFANDGSMVFWDERFGFVVPGKRFIETYKLHGGWDQDDSVKGVLIKVWCDNREILDMHRGKTIPQDMWVPDMEIDANLALLFVRSPNGPGEFSIENFSGDVFTIFDEMYDPAMITTVNLADMPMPQDILLEGVTLEGMPESTVYTKSEITIKEMEEMVLAQMQNPGIGRFCNAIMVYFSVFGGFPEYMLDLMEQVVDASQQGYDIKAFAAIEAESDRIMEQLIERMQSEPGVKLDIALATTRVNATHAGELEGRFTEGRFHRVQVAYNKVLNMVNEAAREASLIWRDETKLVSILKASKPMSEQRINNVKNFYWKYTKVLRGIDQEFQVQSWMTPFHKMQVENTHSEMMKQTISNAVAELEAMDMRARYIFTLDLYRWVVTGDERHPLGLSDRLIFQPTYRGQDNIMDILIEAIAHFDIMNK